MAYWFAAGNDPGASKQVTFMIDSDSDKSKLPRIGIAGEKQGNDSVTCLPVGQGSMAISIATGNCFALNSSNTWTKIGG